MSNTHQIVSKFERMGARATITPMTKALFQQHGAPFVIDIRTDPAGESFEILKTARIDLKVLDSRPRNRHLVLSASLGESEERFLCGHDERHWFVAGLPDGADAATVDSAMRSLKPAMVTRKEAKRSHRRGRKADVFLRQGEWFFVPCQNASIDSTKVERYQVLVRGLESKPHVCEFMYRDGEREYECDRYPKLAFFESEYLEILKTRRKAKQWGWRQLPYDPVIYVRGAVSHPDHAILHLEGWHRVEMNRESTPGELKRLFAPPKFSRVRYLD